MNPSSIEIIKQELIKAITKPYVERIDELENEISELSHKIEMMEKELQKKDEIIAELEAHIEKLSTGKRVTKPVHLKRDEDDVVKFIVG